MSKRSFGVSVKRFPVGNNTPNILSPVYFKNSAVKNVKLKMLNKKHFKPNCNNYSQERTLLCKFCKKTFHAESYFVLHLRSHSVEKRFLCHECGKRFSSYHYLKLHLSKHMKEKQSIYDECLTGISQMHKQNQVCRTRERSFVCSLCKKAFYIESYLMLHLGSHTLEKYLLCDICGKRYSHDHYFKMHRQAHSREAKLHDVWQTGYEHALNQPVDQKHVLCSMQPWQGAVILSNSNRTSVRRVTFGTSITHPEMHLQGHDCDPSVFDTSSQENEVNVDSPSFNSALDTPECSEPSAHGQLPLQNYHSDFSHLTEQNSCTSDVYGHAATEESVLGLEAPNFSAHNSAPNATSGRKVFSCVVCERTFSYACHLNQHLRTHWHRKPFVCSKCRKEFCKQKELREHICEDVKPFVCDTCHKVFPEEAAFNLHLHEHAVEKTLKCNAFQKSLKGKKYISQQNESKRLFICDVCHSAFSDKNTLSQHVCPYAVKEACLCDMCQKANRHRILCGSEEMFACHRCEKTFSQRFDLSQHIRLHAGEKHYFCKVCKERFAHKCALDIHVRSNHKKKILRRSRRGNKVYYEKKVYRSNHEKQVCHVCQICEKSFSEEVSLQKHINAHMELELYECEFCERIFSRKHHLIRHIQTHTE